MDISTLIGNYVFPIAACAAMAWFIWDERKAKREDYKSYVKIAEGIIQNFIDALNSNSDAIQRLECLINKMIGESEVDDNE